MFSEECAVFSVDQLLKGKQSGDREEQGSSKSEDPAEDSEACVDTVHGTEGGGKEDKITEKSSSDVHTTAELEKVLYRFLVGQKVDEAMEKRLKSLFDSCTSVTAKESLLISLRSALCLMYLFVFVNVSRVFAFIRRKLLVEVARQLGYSKVGDCAVTYIRCSMRDVVLYGWLYVGIDGRYSYSAGSEATGERGSG